MWRKKDILSLGSLLLLCFILYGQKPELVFEELTSTLVEYSLTMTPDQKTIYFVKTDSFYVSKPKTIYKSQLEDGKWSTPEIASFSGNDSDSSPFVSPDGKRLFFTSRRPLKGKKVTGGNIWYVELEDEKEGEPVFLLAVNSEKSEYSPSVDLQGNLYFGSYRDGGHGWGDLWWSPYKDGQYQTPKNLGANINTADGEWGSCISPDGSYLIFENSGNEQNLSAAGDLYISFKKDGQWQSPVHYPFPVNSYGSDLTPKIHGDYLYFASNRDKKDPEGIDMNDVNLYRIPLQALQELTDVKK